jgi:hypothetical protein
MKAFFTWALFFTSSITFSGAADSSSVIAGRNGGGEHAEIWFRVKDEASVKVVNSLFLLYPETKRKNYTHNFRNISVKGIEGMVDLTVNEGIYFDGAYETSTPGYFRTFTSNRYRAEYLKRMNDKEGFGVMIYVRKHTGKEKYIYTPENKNSFLSFIYTLIDYKSHD